MIKEIGYVYCASPLWGDSPPQRYWSLAILDEVMPTVKEEVEKIKEISEW